MSKLKVPSLQHLARNLSPDPLRVKNNLVALAKSSPTFSYQPLHDATRDLLLYQLPYEQIERGLVRESRGYVRDKYLSAFPLINSYFGGVRAGFVHSVVPRYYPIGRGLSVPFSPPLIYSVGGEVFLPWFSFWLSAPLSGEKLSFFMTIVEDIISQDPDLDFANFRVLDFSAPSPGKARTLEVINSSDVPKMSPERLEQLLGAFVEGYELAEQHLAGIGEKKTVRPSVDDSQLSLFD